MNVALLGVPWDEQSSYLRGAAGAPGAIRAALASPSSNWSTEAGLDLARDMRLDDAGDLTLEEGRPAEETIAAIEAGAARVLDTGAALVALGGDHAVSYPLVRAQAQRHGPLSILHLDAHPDLYDVFEGNRFSHACPFARILENGLARRVVQIGIRTMVPHQRAQAERFGVEVIDMMSWRSDVAPVFEGPVYLSLDLDVMDPGFVPGTSHHEPGGLTPRDVLRIIQGFSGRLVGADIVELNPTRDVNGMTAMVAAKCVKEVVGRLLATV